MRDRIFYSICFGFVCGVLLRSFLFLDFYFAVLSCILALALILFFSLVSQNKWGIIAGIFLLAFSLGVLRFNTVDLSASNSAGILADKVGEKVSLSGIIIDEPDIRESSQKLTILIRTVLKEVSPRTVLETKILVTTDFSKNFKYGDELKFEGVLEKPENFMTAQGKNFDYINYLRKDGIYYVMSYVTPEIISRDNGNKIKAALFALKEKLLEKINLAIPSPESSLLGGLILGERSSFSAELREKLINTGTIHIVALSGQNVTLVAEWMMGIFAFLLAPLGWGGVGPGVFPFFAGILGILLFVVMTGAQSTAIRAGVMATLALIARALGRNYDIARVLLLVGVGMIILNPFVLAFDVSFQLSFMATFALIFFTPKVEKYFLWVPSRFLREISSVTFAIYIFVLPFILYKMGTLSLVAFPANVLILPFIPLTMILGFLLSFAGIILPILAVPLGHISYIFLHFELWVVDFFSRFSFAAFSIPSFPLFLTLLIYAFFIYKLFGRNVKNFFISE